MKLEQDNNSSLAGFKITTPEMKKAIWHSGYLLEQRVGAVLNKYGYKVYTNRGFIDQDTNKTREYDVYACRDIEIFGKRSCDIYPTFICECKNNPQPINFFVQQKELFQPLIDEVRVSGLPSKIYGGDGWVSIQEFLSVNNIHHYCKPEGRPVATQCCTFEKRKFKSPDKKEITYWAANRDDELNETYRTLVKALEQEINDDYAAMCELIQPDQVGKEFVDLSFYYPVVIYQGELCAVFNGINSSVKEDDLDVRDCEHIQFNPEFISNYDGKVVSYQLDIITESYLPKYIELVENEMSYISQALLRQRPKVRASVSKLVGECMGLEKDLKACRKIMEYEF